MTVLIPNLGKIYFIILIAKLPSNSFVFQTRYFSNHTWQKSGAFPSLDRSKRNQLRGLTPQLLIPTQDISNAEKHNDLYVIHQPGVRFGKLTVPEVLDTT